MKYGKLPTYPSPYIYIYTRYTNPWEYYNQDECASNTSINMSKP